MARRKRLVLDLVALLPSWELALRAERKSAQTIKSYGDGVRGFIRWCESNDHTPALDRDLVAGPASEVVAAVRSVYRFRQASRSSLR